MCGQQNARRRQQPERHTHAQRTALPAVMQPQPDAAGVENHPAEEIPRRRQRRVKREIAVHRTRDQSLHRKCHGGGKHHRARWVPVHGRTEQVGQQDKLHEYENVVQMHVGAARQQVAQRMLMRRAENKIERQIGRRPDEIRYQYARKPAAYRFEALPFEFSLRERSRVAETGQHQKQRHREARQLIPDKRCVRCLPRRGVYHHNGKRRRGSQAVHLPKPHCFPPCEMLRATPHD